MWRRDHIIFSMPRATDVKGHRVALVGRNVALIDKPLSEYLLIVHAFSSRRIS